MRRFRALLAAAAIALFAPLARADPPARIPGGGSGLGLAFGNVRKLIACGGSTGNTCSVDPRTAHTGSTAVPCAGDGSEGWPQTLGLPTGYGGTMIEWRCTAANTWQRGAIVLSGTGAPQGNVACQQVADVWTRLDIGPPFRQSTCDATGTTVTSVWTDKAVTVYVAGSPVGVTQGTVGDYAKDTTASPPECGWFKATATGNPATWVYLPCSGSGSASPVGNRACYLPFDTYSQQPGDPGTSTVQYTCYAAGTVATAVWRRPADIDLDGLAACESGVVFGGGFDVATGKYRWACANAPFSAILGGTPYSSPTTVGGNADTITCSGLGAGTSLTTGAVVSNTTDVLGGRTAQAGSTTTSIVVSGAALTAHALKGDVVKFTSGTLNNTVRQVVDNTTTAITVDSGYALGTVAAAVTINGVTHGTAVIDTMANTTGVFVGMAVAGTGIPAGEFVVSCAPSCNSVSGTSVTVTTAAGMPTNPSEPVTFGSAAIPTAGDTIVVNNPIADACLGAGMQIRQNAMADVMLAEDNVMPGGTVYFPNFLGYPMGVYVDRGCGMKSAVYPAVPTQNTCPVLHAPLNNVATHGINIFAGIRAVGPSVYREDPPVGPANMTGAYLEFQTGRWQVGKDPSDWSTVIAAESFQTGLNPAIDRVVTPTSTTNATPNPTANPNVIRPSGYAYGAHTSLAADFAVGATQMCLTNETTGVCRNDRRYQCTAGFGSDTAASAGGCNYSPGLDLGICDLVVDAIGQDFPTGIVLRGAFSIKVADDATTISQVYGTEIPVTTVVTGGGGLCGGVVTATENSTTTVTGLQYGTANLAVGMTVTGTNIPGSTTIASIVSTAASATFTGGVSATVPLASATAVVVGEQLFGLNIPWNEFVVSCTPSCAAATSVVVTTAFPQPTSTEGVTFGNAITLNHAATATGSDTLTINGGAIGRLVNLKGSAWPFMDTHNVTMTGLVGQNSVWVPDWARMSNAGGGFQNITFMPVNAYKGPSGRCAVGTTTGVGDEAECDSAEILALMEGDEGGFDNIAMFYGSTIQDSALDGTPWSWHQHVRNSLMANATRSPAVSDMAQSAEYESIVWRNNAPTGSVINLFGPWTHLRKMRFENDTGQALMSFVSRGDTVDDTDVIGGNTAFGIFDTRGIQDFNADVVRAVGFTGPLLSVSIQDVDKISGPISVRHANLQGGTYPVVWFHTFAGAAGFVSSASALRSVLLSDIHATLQGNSGCLVAIDNSNVAAGIIKSMNNVLLEDSSINMSGLAPAYPYCQGAWNGALVTTTAGSDVDDFTTPLQWRPRNRNVLSNDQALSDWTWPEQVKSSFPICQANTQGAVLVQADAAVAGVVDNGGSTHRAPAICSGGISPVWSMLGQPTAYTTHLLVSAASCVASYATNPTVTTGANSTAVTLVSDLQGVVPNMSFWAPGFGVGAATIASETWAANAASTITLNTLGTTTTTAESSIPAIIAPPSQTAMAALCTASGLPWPCCTGAGAGATCDPNRAWPGTAVTTWDMPKGANAPFVDSQCVTLSFANTNNQQGAIIFHKGASATFAPAAAPKYHFSLPTDYLAGSLQVTLHYGPIESLNPAPVAALDASVISLASTAVGGGAPADTLGVSSITGIQVGQGIFITSGTGTIPAGEFVVATQAATTLHGVTCPCVQMTTATGVVAGTATVAFIDSFEFEGGFSCTVANSGTIGANLTTHTGLGPMFLTPSSAGVAPARGMYTFSTTTSPDSVSCAGGSEAYFGFQGLRQATGAALDSQTGGMAIYDYDFSWQHTKP